MSTYLLTEYGWYKSNLNMINNKQYSTLLRREKETQRNIWHMSAQYTVHTKHVFCKIFTFQLAANGS